MRSAACDSVYDVVFWLTDRALNDSEYLQPYKMHSMMFLAQAYYGALHKRRLVPAIFIAGERGPIEPNVFRIFASSDRPYIERLMVPEPVERFLDSLWRRFGHHSADYLVGLVRSHQPYKDAIARGPRTEIAMDAMVRFYGRSRSETQARAIGAPNADQVLKPRLMRTQAGKPVAVKAWAPAAGVAKVPTAKVTISLAKPKPAVKT